MTGEPIFVTSRMIPMAGSLRENPGQDTNISEPKIRFPVLEGDKLMKEVLNGGYNVHPVPPPNSEIKERIRKRYESATRKMK